MGCGYREESVVQICLDFLKFFPVFIYRISITTVQLVLINGKMMVEWQNCI